jgi:hypothetical protein
LTQGYDAGGDAIEVEIAGGVIISKRHSLTIVNEWRPLNQISRNLERIFSDA